MQNAAVRLLALKPNEVQDNATDIILGQLRATIATMDIEEINADREKFERKIMENVESELRKIGVQLINVNITDISDDSGYIESLGKKSASEAINQAKVDVAEQERKGASGQAAANREQRIAVAAANAQAVEGENEALMAIAKSNAARTEVEAEARRRTEAAQLVQSAKANQEAYEAERLSEIARQAREKATREANERGPAQVSRDRIVVEAEAEAVRLQRIAEGEAKKVEILAQGEAIKIQKLSEAEAVRLKNIGAGEGENTRLRMEGEARGLRAILESRAEGLRRIVEAAGKDAQAAGMLLLAEQAPELYTIQADAMKNVKIDKVTLVGGMNGQDGNTLGKVAGDYLSLLPSLHESAKALGLTLPSVLGKPSVAAPAASTPATERDQTARTEE
jgi:flotillin